MNLVEFCLLWICAMVTANCFLEIGFYLRRRKAARELEERTRRLGKE